MVIRVAYVLFPLALKVEITDVDGSICTTVTLLTNKMELAHQATNGVTLNYFATNYDFAQNTPFRYSDFGT